MCSRAWLAWWLCACVGHAQGLGCCCVQPVMVDMALRSRWQGSARAGFGGACGSAQHPAAVAPRSRRRATAGAHARPPPCLLPQDKCEPPVYVSDRRFMKAVKMLQVRLRQMEWTAVLVSCCLLPLD